MPWIIGGLIGAVLIYFFMKNRQPATMSQPSPIVNIDTSGLERRLEDLSMRLDQMQFAGVSPNSYLTTAATIPITKIIEPLITSKITDVKMDTPIEKEIYDVSATITNATATDPIDPHSNVYDTHNIFNNTGRKINTIYVSNDSTTGVLFVRVSHVGRMNTSYEVPIYENEVKEYQDVYELKLRSPTKDLAYRVTEYKITKK